MTDALQKAGTIHRDISVGNILLYEGKGLIADLEYVKKEGILESNAQKDPKTVRHWTCFDLLAN